MKRLLFILMLLWMGCATQMNIPGPAGTTGHDDANPIYQPGCGSQSSPITNSNALGCSNAGTNLYTYITKEKGGEDVEYGFINFVYDGISANACLGTTGPSLVMTPTSCIAYNAGIRGTDTGSITFANNSTTWVAMDENTSGSNAGLPNFARVAGTHYLTDSIDALEPSMVTDSQLLMKVTTSGGAITAVQDLRRSNPFPPVLGIIYAGDYGVKCDGSTDDTTGMNRALTAAASHILQLPPGTCKVGVLTPPSNIRIVGAGRNATILSLNSDIGIPGQRGMIYLAADQQNVSIEHLTLQGNRGTYADTNNYGILAPSTGTGVSHISADDIEILSFGGAGFAVFGPARGATPTTFHSYITLRNSLVSDNGYHGFITQGYVDHVKVLHNTVQNWGQLVANSVGITCGRYGKDCLIDGNRVASDPAHATGASAHCISVDTGFDMTVVNNPDITGCVGFGIEDGFSNNVVIANNNIHDLTRDAIAWDTGGDAAPVSDVVTSSGSTTITSALGEFYPAMFGEIAAVSGCGPGGSVLNSRIISVARTTLVLLDACGANQTGATVTWPLTSNNAVIANNVIRGADTGGSLASIRNNLGGSTENAHPYSTNDFTCTSPTKNVSCVTCVIYPFMNGSGVSLTGCGPAGATLNTTWNTEASSTSGTITDAASTSVAGTSTGSISSDYAMSTNITVANNVISFSGGVGIDFSRTDFVTVLGNVIQRATLGGIFARAANHIELGGNVVNFANTSITAGQSGIVINMITTIGTAFTAVGPNSAFGNGNGQGGIQDQLYEVDSAASAFPNFSGQYPIGFVPSKSGAVLGDSTHLWTVDSASESILGGGVLTSSGGTAPTCGANCASITAGSTNVAGQLKASAASPVVNFSASGAWTNAPYCTVSDETTALATQPQVTATTAALTITDANILNNDFVHWICVGK